MKRIFLFLLLLGLSQLSFSQECTGRLTLASCQSNIPTGGGYCQAHPTSPDRYQWCPGSSSSSSSSSSAPSSSSASSASSCHGSGTNCCPPHLVETSEGGCDCANPGTQVNTGNFCENTCPFGSDDSGVLPGQGMCYPEDCPYGDGPPGACNDRGCSEDGYKSVEFLPGTWLCVKDIPDSGASSSSGSDPGDNGGGGPGDGGGDGDGDNGGGMDGSSSSSRPVSSASSTSSFENPICPTGWAWSGNTCFKLPPEEGEEPVPDGPDGPNCGSHSYWNGVQCLPRSGNSSSAPGNGDGDVVIPDTSSSAGSSVAGGGGAGDGFCTGKDGEDDDKDCSGIYNPDGHVLDIQDRYDQAKENYQTVYEELSGELRDRLSLELGAGRDELACNPQKLYGTTVELGICARTDFFDLIRGLFLAVAGILSTYIILRKG